MTVTEGPSGPSDPTAWLRRVESQDAGERIDRWLSQQIPEYSRSAIQRFIEEGRVTFDGKPCRPSQRILADSVVQFQAPPPPSPMPLAEDHPLDMIYEDEHILVISKEAGMIVHPAPGHPPEKTLVNALLGHSEQLSTCGGQDRPGIVHRLDRETSGLMIIARSDQSHRELARQFHDREVSKEYLALCHGVPTNHSGEIDLSLGRSLTNPKKRVVRHDKEARSAFTAWKLDRVLAGGRESSCGWFHCFPRTGRTHQIRVHLRAIGHPILCDFLYGRETRADLTSFSPDAPPAILERHALHAWRLFLHHPISHQPMQFEAPLPGDLAPWWEAASPISAG